MLATGAVSELRVSFAVPRWGVAIAMSTLFLAYCGYIALVTAVRALQKKGETGRERLLAGRAPIDGSI